MNRDVPEGERRKGHHVRPEVRAAAQWWANQLRSPPVQDNGEEFESHLLSLASAKRSPLTEDYVQRFEDSLTELLHEQIGESLEEEEAGGSPLGGSSRRAVGTDYDPDPTLREACRRAGIDSDYRFPVKTVMWIDPGEVRTKRGYRAPIETLVLREEDNAND